MKMFGAALLGLGIAIVVGGGGLPVIGGRSVLALLAEYKVAKSENRAPSLDQQGAYYTYMSYLIGGVLAIVGTVAWVIGFVLEA